MEVPHLELYPREYTRSRIPEIGLCSENSLCWTSPSEDVAECTLIMSEK
jgi:hypothetical protein